MWEKPQDFFTILILSYNRKEFLQQCLNEVYNSNYDNYKVVIYDNASTDDSVYMLKSIKDEQVEVIFGEENIGQNAYHFMHEKCRGHVVTLDDDVIEIPSDWLSWFTWAIHEIPNLGYMSSDVIQDELTNGAKPSDDNYETNLYGDLVVQEGKWTGGWCSVVPQWVYAECGPYTYKPGLKWVPTDGFYCSRVRKKGLKVCILNNVKVYHASGEKCNDELYKDLWASKMENAKAGGWIK
jgi:GT2 family glycosyltransferase